MDSDDKFNQFVMDELIDSSSSDDERKAVIPPPPGLRRAHPLLF
jgi:hypothetical protein